MQNTVKIKRSSFLLTLSLALSATIFTACTGKLALIDHPTPIVISHNGVYGYYSDTVFCSISNNYCGSGANQEITDNGCSHKGQPLGTLACANYFSSRQNYEDSVKAYDDTQSRASQLSSRFECKDGVAVSDLLQLVDRLSFLHKFNLLTPTLKISIAQAALGVLGITKLEFRTMIAEYSRILAQQKALNRSQYVSEFEFNQAYNRYQKEIQDNFDSEIKPAAAKIQMSNPYLIRDQVLPALGLDLDHL